MNHLDWETGEGYPDAKSSFDVWRTEFLKRSKFGLAGRPHFKLADGSVEFFTGPSVIQIEADGAALAGSDESRSSVSRMVIEFHLDQDLDTQLAIAKRWLTSNQIARYSINKNRKRVEKYARYLRALDASNAGQSQSQIASILHSHLSSIAGVKQVSNDLKAAKRLVTSVFLAQLKRR